ncbi:MAG: 4-hydroxythreonine-4-phosphate dehydrogenase PdxA [Sulfurimonas sp. RIFOXYD12_FULL_33_39]|uniref:4-hydroxythreonine-4-phosphate dehydrogenase n=1 Tax=unclassified Sulfurimonas TaxID=2623549 RepID=UPI0008B35E0D|nr:MULTISPECIES: 4-hydroxythreonine-4-phosphate dehydrogenase [unclassified Sulfurimonas]OHE07383.1 MAG: 4-hydroxythreonine-4-phosphate dehydrogenase PdxA [Sulfurimonas sp. RIFCSPLOWO2_12_FULL_34_6]OHE08847.1 MAG: 4-hydroxythreonine-4-phosphate dehydrogenase PdxA [Sulfurimonas sp. RIFOXYD12_FULL_33_39]OHE14157.1 MAG: 4-hydroxythreonine-4-phosphate dehydrogenase PdxA [Sulfurimonas sp. RIFOXYD2_FULL_34_21]DAB28019.1 MAG TPA: 4-hydroxythreonine-4-phosphate dehydrogenase PdxA [Sulfurimonas sp. UBA1
MKPRIAVSVGDLNGVGIEIALKAHKEISALCTPIYCINAYMLNQAAELLDVKIPSDFKIFDIKGNFNIREGCIDKDAGKYSYDSFLSAIKLCEKKESDAVVTLPIHKEAWMLAGIKYKGHTDLLRDYFKKDAIMMLGCEKMFVALYTEHIPLKDVPAHIKKEKLLNFFLDLNKNLPNEKFAVLGLNPHAGDNGVLGDEEREIETAISEANKIIGKELFFGAIVPDIAFTPRFRADYKYFVAMYHDQGLAPLKALYFDESINVSLNLPIIRTSVDHGTAFDIAYRGKASTLSYINAIKSAIKFI